MIVIPAKAGIQESQNKYENTGHRFSPVRRLYETINFVLLKFSEL